MSSITVYMSIIVYYISNMAYDTESVKWITDFDKYDTDSSSFGKTYSAEAGYRRITNVKPSADFLKGTVLHIVQLHDLRIIGRILAQRLYENISNKNSAQIIIRAECYFIFQTGFRNMVIFLHRFSRLSDSHFDEPYLDAAHGTDFIRMKQKLDIGFLNAVLRYIAGSAMGTDAPNEFLMFVQPDFFKAGSYFSGRHCRILVFSNRL